MSSREDEHLEQACERAESMFCNGSNCAEAVLTAVAEAAGLDLPQPWRLVTALGAGTARRQLTCGAVTGAAVALSAACGRRYSTDAAGKESAYAATDRVMRAVEERFGAVECRALTGLDFTRPADQDAFAERVQAEVCIPLVRLVAAACLAELSDRLPAK